MKPEGPGDPKKKTPCSNTWWTEIKRTVQSPPLCLRRECRLRHSPTVVAGSSTDHRCTGAKRDQVSKGQHLIYCVKVQTAPRKKATRADEATAIAISPRPPERPGALAKFRKSQWTNSRKTSTRKQRYQETKTAIRGRRPSSPETNSMAGRTCVRNVVEKDKRPRVATTQKTKA